MQFKNSWGGLRIFIVMLWFMLMLVGCGGSGGSDSAVDTTVITLNADGTETATTTITNSDGTETIIATTTDPVDGRVINLTITDTAVDGTITETITDEVADGDGITLERVAITVVKPDGERVRTVTTTDSDGQETMITTNSKELSVSRFEVVHSLDPQSDGQVFDKVTADIGFMNDSGEPVYVAEVYFAVGTCGGQFTDVDIYEFGWADYNGYVYTGELEEQGPAIAPLYRRFSNGTQSPCDLYGGDHLAKFIVETVVNNEVVVLMEVATTFTVY